MMPVPMLGASQLVHKPPEAKLLAIHSAAAAHNQPQATPQHHLQQAVNHMQQQPLQQQQSKPGTFFISKIEAERIRTQKTHWLSLHTRKEELSLSCSCTRIYVNYCYYSFGHHHHRPSVWIIFIRHLFKVDCLSGASDGYIYPLSLALCVNYLII